RVVHVHRHDAPVGGIQVGAHEQHRAGVADNGVLGVVVLHDGANGRTHVRPHRVAEGRDVQLVLRIGAAVEVNDQVASVVRNTPAEEPGGKVRPLVDENVV